VNELITYYLEAYLQIGWPKAMRLAIQLGSIFRWPRSWFRVVFLEPFINGIIVGRLWSDHGECGWGGGGRLSGTAYRGKRGRMRLESRLNGTQRDRPITGRDLPPTWTKCV